MFNAVFWIRVSFPSAGCEIPRTRQSFFVSSRQYNYRITENELMTAHPSIHPDQQAADLLERAKRFESEALTAIHDALYPQVFRYVSYRVDDIQACEDITAEVFLRLLKALKQEGLTIDNLRGWLLGTAHHLVQDFYRQSYRRPATALENHDHLPNGHNPVEEVEKWATRRQILGAIRQLTADQQHVLALRFSQELSLQETARIMNKSVEAVKVLQFRALAALRRHLEGSR